MKSAELAIRDEAPGDADAISGVIERAFADAPYSSHTEQAIVLALRRAGALSVSLVAIDGSEIVGHVAFSRVSISDGSAGWYGLGPVAVEPGLHGRGIGAALVREGLDRLRSLGAAGCVVLGEPAYYGRFGFRQVPGLLYPGPPPEYFLALALAGNPPQGTVAYHEGFTAAG